MFGKYLKRINQSHANAAVEFSVFHHTRYTTRVSEHNTCRRTGLLLSATVLKVWPRKCGYSTPLPLLQCKKPAKDSPQLFFNLPLPRRACLRIMLEQPKLSIVGPVCVDKEQKAQRNGVIAGNITISHGYGNIQQSRTKARVPL